MGIRVNDPIDDYRSRLLFGAGLHVGLNANGELFIGRRDRKEFPELATAWVNGRPIRLTCEIHPEDARGTFRIDLSAAVAEGDAPAVLPSPYRISKSNIPAKDLVGNVALVNNLPRATARVPQNGLFAFSDWTIGGPKITADPARAFGPILWTLYTLSDRVMKLTAQMPPLGEDEDRDVRLQIDRGAGWETISTAEIDPLARTATFRVADWDDSRETPYRACWTQTHRDGTSREHAYDGTIRKDPKEKPELVVAGYCCFTDFLFPNANIVEQTRRIDPDVMFFMGDQIYEGVGGFGILRDGDVKRMTVNYLRKLALLGWSFRDLTKNRPTVWMPDDHDVYQGNVWGAGGRKITLDEW
ncbi:MAG: hypothetical protein GX621_00610, partial [Pirellulaceae bacterium]|nr:hypothetical protein [Pirellulaceae bacterium]